MEKKQTHILYGFITGIAMVIVGVTIYLAGAAFIKGMQFAAYIPLLAGLILNAIAYSKANDGYVTYGNVFGSCFKATMLVTICMIAWTCLSPFIFPEMKEKALSMMHDEMLKNPNVNDEQIDTYVAMFRNHWASITIGMVIFSNLLYGAILSLIAAAIAKKKGQAPITSANF